jgi:hypothetical protein
MTFMGGRDSAGTRCVPRRLRLGEQERVRVDRRGICRCRGLSAGQGFHKAVTGRSVHRASVAGHERDRNRRTRMRLRGRSAPRVPDHWPFRVSTLYSG